MSLKEFDVILRPVFYPQVIRVVNNNENRQKLPSSEHLAVSGNLETIHRGEVGLIVILCQAAWHNRGVLP